MPKDFKNNPSPREPSRAGPPLLLGIYGGGCNLFKVAADGGKFTAEQVYANKTMANHHGGVIKVGDCDYGYSEAKGWTCQDLKSGEAKWQEKEKLGKGSIAFADGAFYLRQEGGPGTVALIEAANRTATKRKAGSISRT